MSARSETARARRASPLARALCGAYLLLIVYASLAPWSGWHDIGVGALAYLTAPWPRYITAFDVVVNLLGYLPLGVLGVLALHPRLRGMAAVTLVTLAGALLSGTMEALQTFLPERVASIVDLATNTAGALLGAAFAAPYAPSLIDRGRLAQLRGRWFRRPASLPLTLIALWPLAQAHPSAMLFGTGELRDLLDKALDALDWSTRPLTADRFGAKEFMLAEALVTATGVLAAGLTAAAIMRAAAPRVRLLLALVVAALAAKSIALGVEFGGERAFAWATPGALGGLFVGTLALLAAAAWRPRAVAALALLATLVLIALVNLIPENPYYAHWLQQWRPGRLAHAAAAIEWVATAWPYALLVWLLPVALTARLAASDRQFP